MGLFDYVRTLHKLPNDAHQDMLFQTKDLDSFMEEYIILEDGRLAKKFIKGEWVSDDTIKFTGGFFKTTEEWWETYPITGSIQMYALDADENWVEYRVVFINGVVDSIHPVIDRGESDGHPRIVGERIEKYW